MLIQKPHVSIPSQVSKFPNLFPDTGSPTEPGDQ